MAEVAQAAAAAIPVQKTWAEIEDTIKGIARDAGRESAGERITEEIKRFQSEQRKQSESQKAKGFLNSLMRGGNPKRVKGFKTVSGMEHIEDDTAGHKAAAALPLLFNSDGDCKKAADAARKGGNEWLAELLEAPQAKSLNASTFSAGGNFIPEVIAADFITYLYNTSAVRQLGARVIPMDRGNMTMNRLDTPVTANWIGETQRIVTSQQVFGAIKLSSKKLTIGVGISRDLLRYADGSFTQIVMDDLTRTARVAEDQAFIRADGSEYKPRGIKSLMNPANAVAANASNAFAAIVGDLFKLQYLVDGKIEEQEALAPGFILSKRDAYFLKSLISTDGTFIFLPQMMQGQLIDAPYVATNNIPRTLGVGSDESEIYFGDFSQLVIGQSLNVEISDWDGSSWVDANGNTIHGAQQDMMLKTLILEEDLQLMHRSSFAMLTGVDWSAGLDT